MSHLNGFFPSWIAPMCWANCVSVVKHLPHMSHVNGFFPSWIVLMCRANDALQDKLLPHVSHPIIFSLWWPDEVWVSNLLDFKDFSNMVSYFLNIWMTITQKVKSVTDNLFQVFWLLWKLSWYLDQAIYHLKQLRKVFHNIWFWLFSESIKSPILVDLIWIRP